MVQRAQALKDRTSYQSTRSSNICALHLMRTKLDLLLDVFTIESFDDEIPTLRVMAL